MDWVHTTYRRLYQTGNNTSWLRIPLLARMFAAELLRWVDDDGRLYTRDGEGYAQACVRVMSGSPEDAEAVQAFLSELARPVTPNGNDPHIVLEPNAILIRNFGIAQGILPPQELAAKRTKDAERSAKWREQKRKGRDVVVAENDSVANDTRSPDRSDHVRDERDETVRATVRDRSPNAFANAVTNADANADPNVRVTCDDHVPSFLPSFLPSSSRTEGAFANGVTNAFANGSSSEGETPREETVGVVTAKPRPPEVESVVDDEPEFDEPPAQPHERVLVELLRFRPLRVGAFHEEAKRTAKRLASMAQAQSGGRWEICPHVQEAVDRLSRKLCDAKMSPSQGLSWVTTAATKMFSEDPSGKKWGLEQPDTDPPGEVA